MERHFHEIARALKPGARYVLVVGNSQSLLDVVPLHEAFVHLAATAGLRASAPRSATASDATT